MKLLLGVFVKDSVEFIVRDPIRPSIHEQLPVCVREVVWGPIYGSVKDSIESSIWRIVTNSVRNEVVPESINNPLMHKIWLATLSCVIYSLKQVVKKGE